MADKIRRAQSGSTEYRLYHFHCPGCECSHGVYVALRADDKNHPRWIWNGSTQAPTFQPSILVEYGDGRRCHSFVTDGKIQFLGDSSHHLKGQTVDLPNFDE